MRMHDLKIHGSLRVEFLLKTESGNPKDAGVALVDHPGKPWEFLSLLHTLISSPVYALACSRGPRKGSQSPVSCARTWRHVWTGPML